MDSILSLFYINIVNYIQFAVHVLLFILNHHYKTMNDDKNYLYVNLNSDNKMNRNNDEIIPYNLNDKNEIINSMYLNNKITKKDTLEEKCEFMNEYQEYQKNKNFNSEDYILIKKNNFVSFSIYENCDLLENDDKNRIVMNENFAILINWKKDVEKFIQNNNFENAVFLDDIFIMKNKQHEKNLHILDEEIKHKFFLDLDNDVDDVNNIDGVNNIDETNEINYIIYDYIEKPLFEDKYLNDDTKNLLIKNINNRLEDIVKETEQRYDNNEKKNIKKRYIN